MYHSKISGLGYYVPNNIVTNDDLSKIMDTNDEWIQERTGIQERRHVNSPEETTTSMGVKAAEMAIERSGVAKEDIDFIVFATLSPDYYFPGPRCFSTTRFRFKNGWSFRYSQSMFRFRLRNFSCRPIY